MLATKLQFYSFLSWFTALNGLYTFYFSCGKNKFKSSWKLKIYCFIHHSLCVLAVVRMLYNSAGDPRICVNTLTMGSTAAFCINTCWEKRQGIRKLAKSLIHLEQKYFQGKPSGSELMRKFYMKLVFGSITLLRITLFYPIYLKSVLHTSFVLNLASHLLVFNMLLAVVFGFHCILLQICRSQKLINDRMLLLLTKSRQWNRVQKMGRVLKLYSKLLELCDQLNHEYGHVSVCVLACKSWIQITYGYEITVMVAAPKSMDLSLPVRIFLIISYILDAANLYMATDVADMFTKLREDSRRILRETNRLDRLLSMFILKLALHPKRVVFLNVFAFDRKLTLTLMAKSMLYTICWLQGDYKKLKR